MQTCNNNKMQCDLKIVMNCIWRSFETGKETRKVNSVMLIMPEGLRPIPFKITLEQRSLHPEFSIAECMIPNILKISYEEK